MVVDEGDYAHPVLDICPIPRDAIALIGGTWGSNPRYLLWKNGQELTIEAPENIFPDDSDPNSELSQGDIFRKELQTFAHYLEIINLHLNELQFGESNWAYLLPDNKRGYYIHHRPRTFSMVSCPSWAPNIHESEVNFTVWGDSADRRGIWKGKEVDILYAWDDLDYVRLNRAMYAYRILEDMDLTFEVYGHLINNEGKVTGMVSEAGKGRILKLSDRALIYDTIAKLQSRGYLYRGCGTNRFLITPEGKVRFTEMQSVTSYSTNRQKLEKDAEYWHWQELAELFHEIKVYGRHGMHGTKCPLGRFLAKPSDIKLVIPPPGPARERLLSNFYIYGYKDFFKTHFVQVWEGYQLKAVIYVGEDSKPKRRRVTGTRGGLDNRKSKFDVDDKPLLGTLARARRGVHSAILFHPYFPRSETSFNGTAAYYTHHQINLSRLKAPKSESTSSYALHAPDSSSDGTIASDGPSDTILGDASSTEFATGISVDRGMPSTSSATYNLYDLDISSAIPGSHPDAVDDFFQTVQTVFGECQSSTSFIEEVED